MLAATRRRGNQTRRALVVVSRSVYAAGTALRPTPADEKPPSHTPAAMRLGLFADVHDHLDHLRRAVAVFNAAGCETVLFAGDLVSTFAVPPLRKLACPFVGCYGDNEGNKPGLQAGFSIIGRLEEPPVQWTSPDGLRFVLVHMERQLRLLGEGVNYDVVLCGHTHRPRVSDLPDGSLLLNPGEVSGWTFGNPTVMLFDTTTRRAETISLLPGATTDSDAVEATSRVTDGVREPD